MKLVYHRLNFCLPQAQRKFWPTTGTSLLQAYHRRVTQSLPQALMGLPQATSNSNTEYTRDSGTSGNPGQTDSRDSGTTEIPGKRREGRDTRKGNPGQNASRLGDDRKVPVNGKRIATQGRAVPVRTLRDPGTTEKSRSNGKRRGTAPRTWWRPGRETGTWTGPWSTATDESAAPVRGAQWNSNRQVRSCLSDASKVSLFSLPCS